jgi:hypothetical protein
MMPLSALRVLQPAPQATSVHPLPAPREALAGSHPLETLAARVSLSIVRAMCFANASVAGRYADRFGQELDHL